MMIENILRLVLPVLLYLCATSYFVILISAILVMIKNEVTWRMQIFIVEAIFRYRMEMLESGLPFEVEYTDIEDYDKTLRRWWDWGFSRILPSDKFAIIKPFLEEGGEG